MKSLFSVSREVAIEACRNAIKSIEGKRLKAFDEAVVDQMKHRWWKRAKSHEEAIAYLNSMNSWDNVPWLDIGEWEIMRAKELLGACSVSCMAVVQLSKDDAVFIGKWTKNDGGYDGK